VDDTEYQQTQGDLDIEIVDLPDMDKDDTVAAENRHRSAIDLSRASLKSRYFPRQRTLQLGVTGGIVVIVLLLFLGSSISVRNLATRLIVPPTPVPTATLVPGIDLFYIIGDLPWGQAFLDGHLLARLPIIGVDPPLRFTRGQHVVGWRADPWRVQHCTISVPPVFNTDTCQFNSSVQSPSGPSAWVISFPASLATLPDNQRAALIQASQAAFDTQQSTETVRPGELYNASTRNGIAQGGTSQRGIFAAARQALLATLHFQLDIDPASSMECAINGTNNVQGCFIQQHDCHLFCINPAAPTASSSTPEWTVFAVALPEWDYRTLDNHGVRRNLADAFGGATDYEFLVPLGIIWDGTAWHVTAFLDAASTQEFGNPICGSAEVEVQIDPSLNGVESSGDTWNYASGASYAAGCVAIAVPNTNQINTPVLSPSSPHVAAYCFQRFGVLLAANDIAHHLWPQMPVADAYEQSLALQIAKAAGIT
jgi:hypothetical protein